MVREIKQLIPRIINKKRYVALIDTCANASVCSEALYNAIIQSGAKLIAMPTCGYNCSTEIGRRKQRIKLQCMIPIKIGDRVIEIIFRVIPNLVSELIIGCDFLIEWEASIDFESCVLLIKDGMGELITLFINEDMRKEVSKTYLQRNNYWKKRSLLSALTSKKRQK